MQEQLQHQDFTKFHQMKPKLLEQVDRMLAQDIARLMEQIPAEEAQIQDESIRGKMPIKIKLSKPFLTWWFQRIRVL